ncbi:hypothetical protein GGI20_003744, partial [Coemansia sp. BCRC 34301]
MSSTSPFDIDALWAILTGDSAIHNPAAQMLPSPPMCDLPAFDDTNASNDISQVGVLGSGCKRKFALVSSDGTVDYTSEMRLKKPLHACPHCEKVFSRPSSRDTHIRSHTGEKPHICGFPGCGRGFSVHSNMRRHERTHYY